jgi:hypothetical protein
MKKKNESGAKNSAAAGKNQTSNLATEFAFRVENVHQEFLTAFEMDMPDDVRGVLYLIRGRVTELIECGMAMSEGKQVASERSAAALPDQMKDPFLKLESSIQNISGFLHLVTDKLMPEVEDRLTFEHAGQVAAGIGGLHFNVIESLGRDFSAAHDEYVRLSKLLKMRFDMN